MHLHIWWHCPVANQFWKEIFHIVSQLFSTSITPEPLIVLLNTHPPNLTSMQFKLILQVTTAAKQIVAMA